MKIKQGISLGQLWINGFKHRISYLRMYKSASSTVVNAMDPASATALALYADRFTILRDPLQRFGSMYQEMQRQKLFAGSQYEFMQKLMAEGVWNKHLLPQMWIWNLAGQPDLEWFTLEDPGLKAKLFNGRGIHINRHINSSKQLGGHQVDPQVELLVKEFFWEDFEKYNELNQQSDERKMC